MATAATTSTQRVTSLREATRCTGLIVAEHRLEKAVIYDLLGQREDALRELARIMVTWPPEENIKEYIEARQLRDEIEEG